MKLVESRAELIQQAEGLDGLYRHIETCGRVPYKSESKSDGTVECAKAFVDKMIASKHNAVLEHGTVYLYLEVNDENCFSKFEYPLAQFTAGYNWSDVVGNICARYRTNQYSRVNSLVENTEDVEGSTKVTRKYYITSNYRVIIENGWQDDLQFICAPTEFHEIRYTFKVLTSIGVTREFNRHRALSILEQSTRYCNFSKNKFDNQVSFCKPNWINLNTGIYQVVNNGKDLGDIVGDGYIKNVSDTDTDNIFLQSCLNVEASYMTLLNEGWSPQQAREVLPLCTATEAVYTGFADQWNQFFNLRYFEQTGKVHPNMLELSTKMNMEAVSKDIWRIILNGSITE